MRTTKVTLVAALMAVMGTFNASAAFDTYLH